MSAVHPVVTTQDSCHVDDFSVVAARLLEAACLARDGNCEAAKAQIARAMALLRGDSGGISANLRPLDAGVRQFGRGSLAAWRKRRLTAYIDAHLADPIRVSDLAAALDLSESHFSRAFRCTFGTSAHDYLLRRRIEKAQSLMLISRDPLCAIALHCGLSDQSHFTRVFRRIVGQTPYVWRLARSGEIERQPTKLSRTPAERRVSAL